MRVVDADGDALGDHRRRVGRVVVHEPGAGVGDLADAVEAERAPVGAFVVIGDEVPLVAVGHEPVRLDQPAGRRARTAAIGEAQPFLAPAGDGDRDERGDVDRRRVTGHEAVGSRQPDRDRAEGSDALAQQRREDLSQLGERRERRVADDRCGDAGQIARGRWRRRPPRRRRARGVGAVHRRRARSRRRARWSPRSGSRRARSRVTSRRRVRSVTSSRSASSAPFHDARDENRASSRSRRTGVSTSEILAGCCPVADLICPHPVLR